MRGLVGTVSSEVLEDMMDAVARNSSEDVLRTIDRLLVEGQSPQHFARQMLRFLRNALVAKVAGSDSPVLQISSDERARVSRVAERFSEEDLTRFMQIMLRTHSDLGYKQEQRFHLELGLLKLVHAQRLLPLEQLLSGEAAQTKSGGGPAKPGGSQSRASTSATGVSAARAEVQSSRPPAASPFARPSPFESDRLRKSEPKAASESEPGYTIPRANEVGSSAGAAVFEAGVANSAAVATAVAVEVEVPAASQPEEVTIEAIRNAVLGALEDAGQNVLAHNLEAGEWSLQGSEVAVKVAMSQVLIDVALGTEPKRIIQAALNKATRTPLKFKMAGGVTLAAKVDSSSPSGKWCRRAHLGPSPIRSCSACKKSLAPRFAPSSTRRIAAKR